MMNESQMEFSNRHRNWWAEQEANINQDFMPIYHEKNFNNKFQTKGQNKKCND